MHNSFLTPNILCDSFGRVINYVRLSITDRCNLRCFYCMNKHTIFIPRHQLLTLEELARIGKCFSELGVVKLRITGGEPLLRHNIQWLCEQLNKLPGINDLAITTNGSQLIYYAKLLREAGVTRLNISLDTLNPEKFNQITRGGDLYIILNGITAALEAGFKKIRINTVILPKYNRDEVIDLTYFALNHEIDLAFIEKMSLNKIKNTLIENNINNNCEVIRKKLTMKFNLLPTFETENGPARYYRIVGTNTRIGFISPRSENFCARCNRVRITAEGKLINCLGHLDSLDLRQILRAHPTDDQLVKQAIIAAIQKKPREFQWQACSPQHHIAPVIRTMNHLGG